MSEIVKLTVTSYEMKTAKNGSQYLTVQANGGMYGAWDKDFFSTIQENVGKEYQYHVETKGNYKNIVNPNKPAGKPYVKSTFKPRDPEAENKRQESIEKQSARKDAVLFALGIGAKNVESVIEIAKEFYYMDWTKTPLEEVEEPKTKKIS